MKKYGFINNLGELKLIQTTIYKGEDKFVGFDRNGCAYIYTGTGSKELTKEAIGSYLGITPDQVDALIRSRGKLSFEKSKENGQVETQPLTVPKIVKKLESKQQVKAEIKDTQKGEEKTGAKASVVSPSEVESDKEPDGAVSLEKSEIKSLSLKNQVRYLRNRVKWLEENYVTKEQLLEVIQAISQRG